MKKFITLLFPFLTFYSAEAQHDYALAQHLSTYFLGAQRSGDTDSWIHGPSHLNDGEAVGKDLSGGWYDCGDHIKFSHTEPYAALTLLYGYDKFPEAYPDNYSQAYSAPPSNGIPDILDEVKIQTDWMIKAVDNGTAYYQVGGSEDHNSFAEPVTNSGEALYNGSTVRPVYSATSGHSNALGSSASSLALMSILYAPYDATYAAACLDAAEQYYAIATTNPATTTDASGFYSFLSNTGYHDELGMAAIMLYRATGQASYLSSAQSYATNVSKWDNFAYYSIGHLLYLELYEQTGSTTYLNNVRDKVNGYTLNSCGYVHVSNWGSLRDAGNVAMLCALYDYHAGSSSAYTVTKGIVDFILGSHGYISPDAPADFSFLIGYDELGGGYPQHPHHAAAFGKTTNVWTLYTQESNNPGSVPFENELTGGLAGGPEAECSTFEDNINNYVSSEYCTYYNAAFTGAVAYVNKVENNLVMSTHQIQDTEVLLGVEYNHEGKPVIHSRAEGRYELVNTHGQVLQTIHLGAQETHEIQEEYRGMLIIRSLDQGRSTKILNR